jgi:DNA polymerase III subunit tau, C-terminal domain
VEARAPSFAEGDLLRMLRIYQDAETAIRRSPNARLHVETLLLQWTLLDRTVEIEAVLDALGGAPESERAPRARSAASPGRGSSPASSPPPPSTASSVPAPRARGGAIAGPLTLETVRARWERFREVVGTRRRMLAAALEHATPTALLDGVLTLTVEESDVHAEGLERGRRVLEDAAAECFGQPVRVVLGTQGSAIETAEAPVPKRLDTQRDRVERLRSYRQRDQALDALADPLDLELLD